MGSLVKSKLQEMVLTTPTDYWNDSCSVEELNYAIEQGAVGATTNPVIVLGVVKKEMPLWRDRIHAIIAQNPLWTEHEVAWKLMEETACRGAELLYPVYQRQGGRKGRISIQTDPAYYRDSARILEQAKRFHRLAPNIQVKIPVTAAGLAAMEEATYLGININATVQFTVAQALAVGEAVESGLCRREAEGLPVADMSPVCSIMVGRLDDWLHVLEKRDAVAETPGYIAWSGVAVVKRAHALFQERGYRARLLVAAFRHHLHWSQHIGGDLIVSMPYEWQVLFNASDVEVRDRFHDPVPAQVLDNLQRHFPDFRRAYEPDGLANIEFDTFGPTVRTLRQFIAAASDLAALMRDFMLPNPDAR